MSELLPGLRSLRRAAGMTLETLGAAVGCTGAAVGMWERGEAQPAADKLPALARALGCSIDELFRQTAGGASPAPTQDTNKQEERP